MSPDIRIDLMRMVGASGPCWLTKMLHIMPALLIRYRFLSARGMRASAPVLNPSSAPLKTPGESRRQSKYSSSLTTITLVVSTNPYKPSMDLLQFTTSPCLLPTGSSSLTLNQPSIARVCVFFFRQFNVVASFVKRYLL